MTIFSVGIAVWTFALGFWIGHHAPKPPIPYAPISITIDPTSLCQPDPKNPAVLICPASETVPVKAK